MYRYQSLQLRSLNIDEASHFTEFQVRYLMTRVRKAQAAGRKRIRLAFNPGNVGHGWLKRWFIKPTPEMLGARPLPALFEVWRPLPPPDSRLDPMKVLTHQFVPALYRDNWALQLSDPNYLETNVYPLGGDRARQLAEGDWDANDSMIVGGLWSDSHQVTATDFELLAQGYPVGKVIPWHVCPDKSWLPPPGATIFGSVDYGYGAPWAFYLHAKTADGHTRTFHERYLTKHNDRMQAEKIKADVEFFASLGVQKPEWVVCDPTMWNSRQEMGKESIISVYGGVLSPIGVRLMKGTFGRGARLSRPNRWMDALAVAPDGLPWWSVTANCPNLIRTVPEVPWDDDDPEVENDESENHAYESVGRFFEARPHSPRVKQRETYFDVPRAVQGEYIDLDRAVLIPVGAFVAAEPAWAADDAACYRVSPAEAICLVTARSGSGKASSLAPVVFHYGAAGMFGKLLTLERALADAQARLTEQERQTVYWRTKCEQLIDQALARAQSRPVMVERVHPAVDQMLNELPQVMTSLAMRETPE